MLTREEMHERYLFDRLARTLQENLTPNEVLVRNLTNVGWWREEQCPVVDDDDDEAYNTAHDQWAAEAQPEGQRERHLDLDRRDIQARKTEADLCASVALEAIKDYRAYVASGGNPDTLPKLSFDGGSFSVAMKPRNEL